MPQILSSRLRAQSLEGVGGVHLGRVEAYARPLGYTNNCKAKLWALIDGLVLAKKMGLNNLIVELDTLSVVLLTTDNTANLLMEPLLTDCRNLLKEIPNKQIVHAYREANQCIDALAKLGATSLSSFAVFFSPLPTVDSILSYDKTNMCCDRIVNS